MKLFALVFLALAIGASARVLNAFQAQFLNSTTFPPGFDIESLYNDDYSIPEEVICETSDASPLYWHVSWIIDNLVDETEDNLCFSAMVGIGHDTCGPTIRDWSANHGYSGGAAFQLCRDDKSGASYECKGGLPGKTKCTGDKACGGYYPIVIAQFLRYIRDYCWEYDDEGSPRVGGTYLVDGGELRVYRMPG